MKSRLIVAGAIASIALGLAAESAYAINPTVIPCQEAIAKATGKFVSKKLKAVQKCNNKNLKDAPTVSCTPGSLATQVAALHTAMSASINAKCASLGTIGLGAQPTGIGFPGRCNDPNPGDGFTETDLENCMYNTHEAAVDDLIGIQYGTTTGPLSSADQKCQEAIAKDDAKITNATLKAVQKCRNGLNKGKFSGFVPRDCATLEPKTKAAIDKAVSKGKADIIAKCTPANFANLDVCHGAGTDPTSAANCIATTNQLAADDPSPTSNDMIDIEYATPPTCGDGVINVVGEECDVTSDGCVALGFSGPCGAAGGNFACLCLDIPRERVIEHANADLDNGWTGQSHDSGIVEGGGYVADLYDCDNISDFLCNIGPSCVGAPNSPCSNDGQCTLQGGSCRKRGTAVGPHCALNPQVSCPLINGNASCTGTGNSCVTTFHGPPLPLSSGGIPVCILNIFKEDVTGTRNLTTGDSEVHVHQASIINLGAAAAQPCPVCGNYCDDANNVHRNCTTNADCASIAPVGTVKCNHSPICSGGPNIGKECRPSPPYGGPTALFGTTSIDCPPTPNNISGPTGLDIDFNPATTGTVSFPPSIQCDSPQFSNKRCLGGANYGQVCTVDSECPSSTCNNQCYCPTGGGLQEKPNNCDPACFGGPNDKFPCSVDSECPGGLCHPADCRADPTRRCFSGANDSAVCLNNSECPGGSCPLPSPNEGGCTATVQGICSASRYKTCDADAKCQPPLCPTCQPTETCVVTPQNCFINSGITRVGVPHPTNPLSASKFCITATNFSSVNSTAGLPGPGALLQPATVVDTGL